MVSSLIKKYGKRKLLRFLTEIHPHLTPRQKKLNKGYLRKMKFGSGSGSVFEQEKLRRLVTQHLGYDDARALSYIKDSKVEEKEHRPKFILNSQLDYSKILASDKSGLFNIRKEHLNLKPFLFLYITPKFADASAEDLPDAPAHASAEYLAGHELKLHLQNVRRDDRYREDFYNITSNEPNQYVFLLVRSLCRVVLWDYIYKIVPEVTGGKLARGGGAEQRGCVECPAQLQKFIDEVKKEFWIPMTDCVIIAEKDLPPAWTEDLLVKYIQEESGSTDTELHTLQGEKHDELIGKFIKNLIILMDFFHDFYGERNKHKKQEHFKKGISNSIKYIYENIQTKEGDGYRINIYFRDLTKIDTPRYIFSFERAPKENYYFPAIFREVLRDLNREEKTANQKPSGMKTPAIFDKTSKTLQGYLMKIMEYFRGDELVKKIDETLKDKDAVFVFAGDVLESRFEDTLNNKQSSSVAASHMLDANSKYKYKLDDMEKIGNYFFPRDSEIFQNTVSRNTPSIEKVRVSLFNGALSDQKIEFNFTKTHVNSFFNKYVIERRFHHIDEFVVQRSTPPQSPPPKPGDLAILKGYFEKTPDFLTDDFPLAPSVSYAGTLKQDVITGKYTGKSKGDLKWKVNRNMLKASFSVKNSSEVDISVCDCYLNVCNELDINESIHRVPQARLFHTEIIPRSDKWSSRFFIVKDDNNNFSKLIIICNDYNLPGVRVLSEVLNKLYKRQPAPPFPENSRSLNLLTAVLISIKFSMDASMAQTPKSHVIRDADGDAPMADGEDGPDDPMLLMQGDNSSVFVSSLQNSILTRKDFGKYKHCNVLGPGAGASALYNFSALYLDQYEAAAAARKRGRSPGADDTLADPAAHSAKKAMPGSPTFGKKLRMIAHKRRSRTHTRSTKFGVQLLEQQLLTELIKKIEVEVTPVLLNNNVVRLGIHEDSLVQKIYNGLCEVHGENGEKLPVIGNCSSKNIAKEILQAVYQITGTTEEEDSLRQGGAGLLFPGPPPPQPLPRVLAQQALLPRLYPSPPRRLPMRLPRLYPSPPRRLPMRLPRMFDGLVEPSSRPSTPYAVATARHLSGKFGKLKQRGGRWWYVDKKKTKTGYKLFRFLSPKYLGGTAVTPSYYEKITKKSFWKLPL